MITFEKVSLKKVTNGLCPKIDLLKGRNERVVFLSNGGLKTVDSILRDLGNNEIDTWLNIEKIKKSTSDKNILKYIKQFENKLNY